MNKIPAASRRALLTERKRDAQNCAESTPIWKGKEFSLFGFWQFFAKNKCAKLGIAKTGFLNPQKAKENIKTKNRFYFPKLFI